MLRPHLGSLARLTTGAQKVEYAFPAFMRALASRPIWAPVAFQRVRLNDMPVVMGKANLVVATEMREGKSGARSVARSEATNRVSLQYKSINFARLLLSLSNLVKNLTIVI